MKRAFVAGKRRHLQCDMRILTATVQDAVSNFKKSPEWKQFRHDNPDSDVNDKTVASCICPCMKPDSRGECACPTCGYAKGAPTRDWNSRAFLNSRLFSETWRVACSRSATATTLSSALNRREFRSAGRVVGPLGSVPTLLTTTRPCLVDYSDEQPATWMPPCQQGRPPCRLPCTPRLIRFLVN